MTATVTLADELESTVVDLFVLLTRTATGDLSRTAASVLREVATQPRRITELATRQAVAQPTMTVLIGRLEARGHVTREPDPTDRRATLVHATDAGREALAARRDARAALLADRIAGLDADGRAALAAALPVLRDLTGAR